MANKTLFQTVAGAPAAAARNEAGGVAYALAPAHALAQYAATGCFNNTFYASAAMQLEAVVSLCDQVAPETIAKTAVYAREQGFMKDMPALLVALLSVYDAELCERVFDRVIDDGKMLRNFVQIVRSGQVGRRSLGALPQRSDEQVLRASVGQDPSLADVIKMAHPRPETASRRALYAWIVGRPYDAEALPPLVRAYERWKERGGAVPDVPFQLLTAQPLGHQAWLEIARNATWTQTRMNLLTFARHGVFQSKKVTELVAARLRDREQIARARVFPYQLMTAWFAAAAGGEVPRAVRSALEQAMEISLANVPQLRGKVYVCCDVSGSMSSPLTGHRAGATSKVRCIDVAGLMTAALLRHHDAEALAFEQRVVPLKLDGRASVMANARKLASVGGGGTSCAAPLALLNERGARGSLVIYVSDNESWVDAPRGRGTETMREWVRFRARNPQAKLVCIDLQPYGTTQACDDASVLNVGGFSDVVFEVLAAFATGGADGRHWSDVIARVQL
jgi:60 kDa SS-A/Ro ribonucleoprotein